MTERRLHKGDRITITAGRTTHTGRVYAAFTYTDSQGRTQYNIELMDDTHGYVYWKSETDGGTWTLEEEPEPEPAEFRTYYDAQGREHGEF